MSGVDEAVARYEVGDTWRDDDEVVEVEVKRPLDKVIPVRLPADKWEALRAEAKELGIGPSTLVRMWVLERLRAAQAAPPVAPTPPSMGVAFTRPQALLGLHRPMGKSVVPAAAMRTGRGRAATVVRRRRDAAFNTSRGGKKVRRPPAVAGRKTQ